MSMTRIPKVILWLDRWSHSTGCQHKSSRNASPKRYRPQDVCSCWREQEKFTSAVKLTDEDSLHPSHIQFGTIFRMVSPQTDLSEWHNFTSVILASKTTIWRCAEPSNFQVQVLSCISLRRLLEMPEAVPESSHLLVLHAPSSLSSLLALQSQSDLWIDTA